MNTIKFLSPILIGFCMEQFLSGDGDICVVNTPKPMIKYYEPKKSCYVNGIFYTKCEDRLNKGV